MSSVFFHFYYDDGSIRPFDPEATSDNNGRFEVPEVLTDGVIDLFELSSADLKEAGLNDDAFWPIFIADYQELVEDNGTGINGLGIEQNIYCDSATIPVEPAQLKSWAQKWLQTLQGMNEKEQRTVLVANWVSADEIMNSLSDFIRQAECAKAHHIAIMLYIAW